MHEAADRPSKKLACVDDAARSEPGYFHGQVAAEFVRFLLIKKMRVAANYGPCGLKDCDETIGDFFLIGVASQCWASTQAPILWMKRGIPK